MKEDQAVEWCDCLIDIAAALFCVSGRELRRPGRSTLDVARVRQIAMYVGHVVLRLSMSDVGRGFGRDRTTVLYACHLVEDMRDDTDFDRIVATMERVVDAAFRERGTI
jgi:chromosomal replication initiation ATPase DnaA